MTRRDALLPALLLLAAFAAFGGALSYDFVRWDDPQLVTENPLVANHSPAVFATYDPELYIPLTFLSFQLEHLLFGYSAAAFHATNLLLHGINVLLVFALLSTLLRDRLLGFAGALLFAVHPLHAEAVSWVSARKELLMTACALGSILCYVRSGGRASKFLAASIGLFLLALLAKVTAIGVPAVLLAIDAARGERLSSRSVIEKWPFFLLAIVFGIVAFFGKRDAAALLPPADVVLLAVRSTTFYLQKFFWPSGLSAIHPAPASISLLAPPFFLSGLIVAALLTSAWLLRRRAPLFALGITFFFLTLAPSFLAYAKSGDVLLAADRYAYLPSIGLLLAGLSIDRVILRPRIIAAFAAAALILLPFARIQSATWTSTEALFNRVLALHPEAHVALNNLAFLRLSEGRLDEALALAQRAVAEKDAYADAWANMGGILGRMDRIAEAETALQKAVTLQPDHPQAHVNLGAIAGLRGQWDLAVRHYEAALAAKPGWPLAEERLKTAREKANVSW